MAYSIGTVTKGGGLDTHYQFLALLKTLAEANGWTTLRYDTSTANREWIGKSLGLSGTEEIYIGFRTYQDIGADYYNILAGCFIGYVPASPFDNQPGGKYSGIAAHNNAITYFMTADAQSIQFCLKVGTPVYEYGGAGKFFTYARPGEYPAPLFVMGMLEGAEARRFSDTVQVFPYWGAANAQTKFYVRDVAGAWRRPHIAPFSQGNQYYFNLFITASNALVPAGDNYQLEPLMLFYSGVEIWGEFPKVFSISGFNNGVENVLQEGGISLVDQTGMSVSTAVAAILAVGGRAFVVLQNVRYTGWHDYIAMEMK